MGDQTNIAWCDKTFNPWVGCTKVSPACDNCYAERWAKRSGSVIWGEDRRRTSKANWKQPLKWDKEAKEKGIRYKVFCASLADVFDNQVPDSWRRDLFKLIAAIHNFNSKHIEFIDFYPRCTEFTHHYLWCCYAIVWGIKQYDQFMSLKGVSNETKDRNRLYT